MAREVAAGGGGSAVGERGRRARAVGAATEGAREGRRVAVLPRRAAVVRGEARHAATLRAAQSPFDTLRGGRTAGPAVGGRCVGRCVGRVAGVLRRGCVFHGGAVDGRVHRTNIDRRSHARVGLGADVGLLHVDGGKAAVAVIGRRVVEAPRGAEQQRHPPGVPPRAFSHRFGTLPAPRADVTRWLPHHRGDVTNLSSIVGRGRMWEAAGPECVNVLRPTLRQRFRRKLAGYGVTDPTHIDLAAALPGSQRNPRGVD